MKNTLLAAVVCVSYLSSLEAYPVVVDNYGRAPVTVTVDLTIRKETFTCPRPTGDDIASQTSIETKAACPKKITVALQGGKTIKEFDYGAAACGPKSLIVYEKTEGNVTYFDAIDTSIER